MLLNMAKDDLRAAKESTPLIQRSGAEDPPPPPTLAHALYFVATDSAINLLLLCMPFAIYAYYAQWSDTVVFAFNFLSMIPLAKIIGDATEEVAFHTGDTIGGLVNATFGNAVEVIIAIFALREGQIAVVQASLLGSILSNLLLVLGCCFVAGGVTQKVSKFNETGASANSTLLMVSAFAMLVPSYYQYTTYDDKPATKAVYIQLLYFQMKTHVHLFEPAEDNTHGTVDEYDNACNMTLSSSIVVLGLATVLVAILSEYLVASIDGFVASTHVSKSFVGIIILPIVGNAVEHLTAVRVAFKQKMELAMGVAVGSATQISLFVVPVTVLAGWVMDQPMTLAFPTFEAVTYVTSVVIVYAIIVDGKSHWLEGSMLLTMYGLIAVSLLWVHV
ncbi:hypothetical protein DYB38_007385 [Aphanomyces astaci]|uniref:Sodium/calcium exchanger membrane region domain-containing protein n=1 Tax=Aphanomyces astaci TaxID=112090 RepID=A0A397DKG3_APHAT|nr:hypothetical protein DYB38_007385 [Aphanomyces astaci]